MLLFVPSCAGGEGWTGANAGPIGIGAAALCFGCRETGLGTSREIEETDVNGSTNRLAKLNRTGENLDEVRWTATRRFARFRRGQEVVRFADKAQVGRVTSCLNGGAADARLGALWEVVDCNALDPSGE